MKFSTERSTPSISVLYVRQPSRAKLRQLEQDREAWEEQKFRMTEENLTLKRSLSLRDIAVTELESLRDHKSVLETRIKLAHQQLEELREDVDKRLASAGHRSPFPACWQMDQDIQLQSAPNLSERKLELPAFIEELRQRMAFDSETGKRLFYAARDVRCFVAGLAMSKLHLLQGVSGTGKTSLPLAFARAIGAGSKLIEVQAGWRDRQDLIGHFNAFDHRFQETEFLKALYRAQCPHLQGRPFIIVLDEMNLSHLEQYGADLLSSLEQDAHLQRLHLLPAALDGEEMPKLFLERSALRIPSNVWFIGTANHDETTRDFADKTYDRAHVMELPRGHKPFETKEQPPPEPLSLAALQKAFSSAQSKHAEDSERAFHFIEEQLASKLARRFRIGWGNRLKRQLGAFVPVIIASGGTVSEATDHIISTKLLRKLRDRHDTRIDDVRDLRDELAKAWPTLAKKNEHPERSLEVLDAELLRLGGEAEDAA